MGSIYVPNPNIVWPSGVWCPDDGDPLNAAIVDVPVQAALDMAAYLKGVVDRSPRLRAQEFLANGTWTAPARVGWLIVQAFGGGGRGGPGASTPTAIERRYPGGSGGGGAMMVMRAVPVVPGTSYDITIGAGGNFANSGFAQDTTIAVSGGGLEIFRAKAAESGVGATAFGDTGVGRGVNVGGGPVIGGNVAQSFIEATALTGLYLPTATLGGGGSTSGGPGAYTVRGGQVSQQGFAGGSGGTSGVDSGTSRGGGGGGGGAGGPRGIGGNGGNGGNGNAGGAPGVGTNGGNAPPNSGAGGGGGGSSGCGTSVAVAGVGGDGGSGYALLLWVEETP